MKLLALLLFVACFSTQDHAATYYMAATGGVDTNPGTQAAPWATVNHGALNCGDVIIALSGTYSNITTTVTPGCSSHNAVFVICDVFVGCKVNGSQTQGGILVQTSYWAFLGWEVTTAINSPNSSAYATCFHATPVNAQQPIHDIYFINDVANGCVANGFSADNGVDYYAAVADIAWNAAQGSAYCFSGSNIYQPIATDKFKGTHLYVSRMFAWHNIDPSPCQGFQTSTDGEGQILDTFNQEQSYNGQSTPQYPVYDQQAVVEFSMLLFNGSAGLDEAGSGNRKAHIFFHNNTAARNHQDPLQHTPYCGQIRSFGYPTSFAYNMNVNTVLTGNLSESGTAFPIGCGGNAGANFLLGNIDSTTLLYNNMADLPAVAAVHLDGLIGGFQAGPANLFGVNPKFRNPVEPPAPSCAGKANVLDCMSTVISDFTPTEPLAVPFGYQPPDQHGGYDPLFPKWLCNVNVPSNLVSKRCDAEPPAARKVSKGGSVSSTVALAPLSLVLPAQFFTPSHPYNQLLTQYPDETRTLATGRDGSTQNVNISSSVASLYGNNYIKLDASIPWNVVDSGKQSGLFTSVLVTHDYSNPRTSMVAASDAYTVPAEPIIGATQESPPSDVWGDNHVLVFDVRTRKLWENWHANYASTVSAASAFEFDVDSISIPPLGQDTVEAAGSSVLAWTLRWDQLSQPMKNAIRIVAPQLHGSQGATLSARTYPAQHAIGNNSNSPIYYGQRFRLDPTKRPDLFNSSYLAGLSVQTRNFLIGLRDYGFVVADIGSDFYLTTDANPAWDTWFNEFQPLLLQMKNFTPVNSGPITDLNGMVLTN